MAGNLRLPAVMMCGCTALISTSYFYEAFTRRSYEVKDLTEHLGVWMGLGSLVVAFSHLRLLKIVYSVDIYKLMQKSLEKR